MFQVSSRVASVCSRVVMVVRPLASSPLRLSRRRSPAAAVASASASSAITTVPVPALTRGFKVPFGVPGDNKNLETEYEHAKGKTLQEALYRDHGMVRWGFGVVTGPVGTFEKPVIILSANPERIVGCHGTGNLKHPTAWFNCKTDGPKHMCRHCGQFFVVKSGIEVPADIAAKIETIERQTKAADKGETPARPDGTKLAKDD